jgi:predicted nuclease of predicted toxin-antitoxin system
LKPKLDENLGAAVAQAIRHAGHDVVTVPQEGLAGADDSRLIAVCQNERRCLITLDLEFAHPLIYRPSDCAGIAVLRLPPRPDRSDILDCVQTLFNALMARELDGKLWIVQRGRIREYQPEDDDSQLHEAASENAGASGDAEPDLRPARQQRVAHARPPAVGLGPVNHGANHGPASRQRR